MRFKYIWYQIDQVFCCTSKGWSKVFNRPHSASRTVSLSVVHSVPGWAASASPGNFSGNACSWLNCRATESETLAICFKQFIRWFGGTLQFEKHCATSFLGYYTDWKKTKQMFLGSFKICISVFFICFILLL